MCNTCVVLRVPVVSTLGLPIKGACMKKVEFGVCCSNEKRRQRACCRCRHIGQLRLSTRYILFVVLGRVERGRRRVRYTLARLCKPCLRFGQPCAGCPSLLLQRFCNRNIVVILGGLSHTRPPSYP